MTNQATPRLSVISARARTALLVSTSMAALLTAVPSWASCTDVYSGACTNDLSTPLYMQRDGANASGDNNGAAGANMTVTNTLGMSLSGTTAGAGGLHYGVLSFSGVGGDGSSDTKNDATKAGAGSTVTVNNSGSLTLNSVTFSGQVNSGVDQPGIFDNANLLTGIYVAGVGGAGTDANVTVVGGGNGGRGGDGGQVTIENSGSITMNSNFVNGGVGIYGASIAGAGGGQDKAASGDQVGGNGGDAKTLNITNSGKISVSSGNAAGEIWGIGAEGLGNDGGSNASQGGTGALVNVVNTGEIDVLVSGVATNLTSVRGISASSQGGDGYTSEDGSDHGGNGEAAKLVTLTNGGNISVSVQGLTAPTDESEQSGGIVLINRGGDGGDGPQNIEVGSTQVAGAGGQGSTTDGTTGGNSTLTVNNAAVISTTGDYVVGVFATTVGGDAGNGREDSAGNTGGLGGNIAVNIEDSVRIVTNGTGASGLVVLASGGDGGGVETSSGVIDLNASTAGDGGPSGNASVRLGYLYDTPTDSVNTTGAAQITTYGANSTGALVQALGGNGGGISSNFQLFGEAAPVSGAGGTGQSAYFSGFADIQTSGDASAGVIAQAIGGGGGVAQEASGLIAVGGNGGTGATSGIAEVEYSGTVTTQGDESIGILVQGLGGGGGAAAGADGVVTIGGQGGTGGEGGAVNISLPGSTITTHGVFSHGIVGQSIGGGGGDGGSVFNLAMLPTGVALPSVGLGGAGGTAGAGYGVTMGNQPLYSETAAFTGPLAVSTSGNNSHAVLLQSIGGGGGSGGNAVGSALFSPLSFQMAGAANAGGNGAGVTVDLDDFAIATTGSHASGIVLQSVGGGGGNGGSASAIDANLTFSMSASVGGVGGDGGHAGTSALTLANGTITTGANATTDSHGIVVQAIGGGGGIGGSSVADALSLAVAVDDIPPIGISLASSVGGIGGGGGDGGPELANTYAATVDLTGTVIQTAGDGSHGIVAQSIGGGGGLGGSASSTSGVMGGSESIGGSISMALGGSGGSGGAGDVVMVNLDATSAITTFGDYSNGIVAQSIGGGGGNGGTGAATTSHAASTFSLTADVFLGGRGGDGGVGNHVWVDLAQGSAITTYGSGARGVLAQSIGGGGGASQGGSIGVAVAGSSGGGEGEEEESSDVSVDMTLTLGRTGGSGGYAEPVNVTGSGVVNTWGGDADGYLLQAIGGGGGLGGSAGSDADDEDDSNAVADLFGGDDEGTSYNFDLSVGGRGGSGGNGGTVSLDYTGQTTTHGDFSDGIVVQSIGGGGGSAGTATAAGSDASTNLNLAVGGQGGAGGNGESLTINFTDTHTNMVNTYGYGAYGVLLQSIGGGGGQGTDGSEFANGHITVGGGQGGLGYGGNITVSDYINTLTTAGDDAPAFVAQSIAGGGGVGLAGSTASTSDDTSHSIALTLGGNTSGQTNSGNVSISLGATSFITSGDRAYGIVAQSIAGGGGIVSAGDGAGITSTTVGGAYYSGNSSGTVGVNWTDSSKILTTHGDGSHAIIAQSISGGGGIAGDGSSGAYSTTASASNAASSGIGGATSVHSTGSLQTYGNNAYGIIAQSLGGNGGLISGPDGTIIGLAGIASNSFGGAVTVTNTGFINTAGDGSVGIFAQSLGSSGQGTINIDVSGDVTGGTGSQGAGIVVNGGTAANTLTINDEATVSARSGTAINVIQSLYGAEQLTVANSGHLTGSVTGTANADQDAAESFAEAAVSRAAAPSGNVAINNTATGVLSDAALYQADINNAGQMVVGSRAVIGSDPAYAMHELSVEGDLAQSGTGELIMATDFTGGTTDTLHVAGDLALNGLLQVEALTIQRGASSQLVTTDGTIAGAFAGIRSEIFSYDVNQTHNTLGVTVSDADFAKAEFGLTGQQSAMANHLEALFYADDASFAQTFASLEAAALQSSSDLAQSYNNLSPQASLAGAAMNFGQARVRFDRLLGCDGFSSEDMFEQQDSCFKFEVSGQSYDQDADNGAAGYSGTIGSIDIVGQRVLDSGLILSGMVGYESSDFDSDGSATNTTGDATHIEVALTGEWQDLSVTAALGLSHGPFDVARSINLVGSNATAYGSYDASSVAARLRAAYKLPSEKGALRAVVDVDLIHASADGYTETGAGNLNLQVDASSEIGVTVSPALEYGQVVPLANGKSLGAYGSLGVSFASLDSYSTQARFASATTALGSFGSDVAIAPVTGRITLGGELMGAGNMSLGAEYNGSFASGFQAHRASVNMRWMF